MMFTYLKLAALNTRGRGSIEPRTVCLLTVFPRATIELTWSRTRGRGIRATASLTCIKIRLNLVHLVTRDSQRYPTTLSLNNLSFVIPEIENRLRSSRWSNGSTVESKGTSIFVTGSESHHGDFNSIFSTSYGNPVNRISLFRYTWIDGDERTG